MYGSRIILVLLAMSVVTGCATQAQMRSKQIQETLIHEQAKIKKCFDEADKNNAEFSPSLSALFIIQSNDPMSVQKMAIDRYMTAQEKTELLKYRSERVQCRALLLEGMSKVHPDFVSYFARWFAKADEESLAVFTDEKTIGESNKTRLRWAVQREAEYQQVFKDIDSELAQSHQAELANRQNATAALQQWNYQQQLLLQNQQMINSINTPRPLIMNCDYYRGTLQCRGL